MIGTSRQFFSRIYYKAFFMELCLYFCLGSVALANDCPKNVQPIEKGEIANCSGFLFSNEAEKLAADYREDVKYYELLVPKLEERIKRGNDSEKVLEDRLQLYMKQSEELAKEHKKNDFERFVMFVLGAGVMYAGFELAETAR